MFLISKFINIFFTVRFKCSVADKPLENGNFFYAGVKSANKALAMKLS